MEYQSKKQIIKFIKGQVPIPILISAAIAIAGTSIGVFFNLDGKIADNAKSVAVLGTESREYREDIKDVKDDIEEIKSILYSWTRDNKVIMGSSTTTRP